MISEAESDSRYLKYNELLSDVYDFYASADGYKKCMPTRLAPPICGRTTRVRNHSSMRKRRASTVIVRLFTHDNHCGHGCASTLRATFELASPTHVSRAEDQSDLAGMACDSLIHSTLRIYNHHCATHRDILPVDAPVCDFQRCNVHPLLVAMSLQ